MSAYTIAQDGQSITCNTCGLTSYNQGDVRHRYCGRCHKFHELDGRDPEIATLFRFMDQFSPPDETRP